MESSDASPSSPAASCQDGSSSVRALRSNAGGDDLLGGLTPSSGMPDRLTSLLRTQEELVDACKKYSVPAGFTPLLAGRRPICAPPPPGSACVHVAAFEGGMRLPLHPFFAAALDHFGVPPSQLAPNGWRVMAGFVVLSHLAGVPPSLPVFRHFFAPQALHHKFRSFRRQDGAGSLFCLKPFKVGGWKQGFFLLKSSAPWPCAVQWREDPRCADPIPPLDEAQEDVAARLLLARGDTPIDLDAFLHETNLIAAGLVVVREPESSPPGTTQGMDMSVDVTMEDTRAENSAAVEQGSPELVDVRIETAGSGGLPFAHLTGRKRKLECDNGDAQTSMSYLSCSPGICQKPPTRINDGDTGDLHAGKQLLQEFVTPLRENGFEASKAGDVVALSYMSLLQTAQQVAFSLDYALDLDDNLCNVKAELAEAKEAVERHKAEADALRLELDSEHSKMKAERWRDAELVGALQVHLAKVKSELVEAKAAGARSMDALQGQLGETNAELATARSAMKTVEAEQDQRSAEAYGLQVELGVAKAKVVETKAARKHAVAVAEALRAELAKAGADIARKKAAAATANAKRKHAVVEMKATVKAERERAAAEASALLLELGGVKTEAKKATEDLRAELHKALSELAVMEATAETVKAERLRDAGVVGALQVHLAKVKAELVETKAAEVRAVNQADELRAELGKANGFIMETEAAAVAANAERELAVAEAEALRLELSKAKVDAKDAMAATATLKAELEHAVAAADALRVELDKANSDVMETKAAAETMESERDHAVAAADTLLVDLGRLDAELAETKAARDHHAAEAARLTAELLAKTKAAAEAMKAEQGRAAAEAKATAAATKAEREQAVAVVNVLREELGKMPPLLASTNSAMETLKAERDRFSAEAYGLQIELGIVKAELVKTTAAGKHTADALRVQLGKANAGFEETIAAAAAVNAKRKQSLAEADSLRTELAKMSSAMETVRAERDRRAAEAHALRVELRREESETEAARKLAAAEARTLRTELRHAKGELSEVRMELDAVSADLAETVEAAETAKAAAVQEFMGSKKYARELADSEMEGYERGLEDMKRAALSSYPKLDPARLVVPIDTGLLAPGRAACVCRRDAA